MLSLYKLILAKIHSIKWFTLGKLSVDTLLLLLLVSIFTIVFLTYSRVVTWVSNITPIGVVKSLWGFYSEVHQAVLGTLEAAEALKSAKGPESATTSGATATTSTGPSNGAGADNV